MLKSSLGAVVCAAAQGMNVVIESRLERVDDGQQVKLSRARLLNHPRPEGVHLLAFSQRCALSCARELHGVRELVARAWRLKYSTHKPFPWSSR